MNILGIDIGGTMIKWGLVNTDTGTIVVQKQSLPTPDFYPTSIAKVVKTIIRKSDYQGSIGIGFPNIVINGRVKASQNSKNQWSNVDLEQLFQVSTAHPVYAGNDADLAGIAEMRFGAGMNLLGTVILVTLGTGIGSALFYNGVLVPNSELGEIHRLEGGKFEDYASNTARIANKLNWEEWGLRLNDYLHTLCHLFSPNYLLIGGGLSHHFIKYQHLLTAPTIIKRASFQNDAGIIGAAMYTKQGLS